MFPRMENAPSGIWVMSPTARVSPADTGPVPDVSRPWPFGSRAAFGEGTGWPTPSFLPPLESDPSRNLYSKAPPKVLHPSNSSLLTCPLRAGPGRSSLLYPRGSNSYWKALWDEPQCHSGLELKGKRSLSGIRRLLRPPSKCSTPSAFLSVHRLLQ